MNYPGSIIKLGEINGTIMKALKQRLNELLAAGTDDSIRLDTDDPIFGSKTVEAVMLFQARNVDAAGRPLVQDGEIGPLTWHALFYDNEHDVACAPPSRFLASVVAVAAGEVVKNVREHPRNSNCGPEVEAYLKSVNVPPGYSWCCAFVHWCFDAAARLAGRENPMPKTGGCLDHWNRCQEAKAARINAYDARNNPSLVMPGMIFIMDHGSGLGHTGIIESINGGLLHTIEGNTDASKTREGGGVYRLVRKVTEINKGFIDYTNA
jgi:hypothetical protein